MAMAVDSRQHQVPFSALPFDPMRYQPPQFSNPWMAASAPTSGQMYATSMPTSSIRGDVKHYPTHTPNVSAAYSSNGLSVPAMSTGMLPLDPDLMDHTSLRMAQDMSAPRSYGGPYASSAAPTASVYAPTSVSQYSPSYGYQADRRPSHSSVHSSMLMAVPVDVQRQCQDSLADYDDRLSHVSETDRQEFSDAVEASRGMVAMSQSDITPRNIYGTSNSSRSSMGSYGFPSTHSSHSSISSGSSYPYNYASSVSDGASVTDYSSASESVDMPSSRTLPRPVGLIGGQLPPAPSSMMGQFSSKVSSSSQKKHKCKICDKRFTRPSSLQTHMYSHTGEKPFACDVDGCGRHFSVVSNLRRHRKVHRGDGHDHPSPDDDDE
ncbi:hypothetical protein LTR53_004159 [Teratosphaeriaceae sp. CCFEE 6253]|nr:hypothetical protein LTR53_004159 [Teratosphaeriaceae sp. CCFEE 6253]